VRELEEAIAKRVIALTEDAATADETAIQEHEVPFRTEPIEEVALGQVNLLHESMKSNTSSSLPSHGITVEEADETLLVKCIEANAIYHLRFPLRYLISVDRMSPPFLSHKLRC
jgi:hypothetical protein